MAPSQSELQLAPEATPRSAWRRLLPVLALVAAAWFGVGWLTSADDRPERALEQAIPLQLDKIRP